MAELTAKQQAFCEEYMIDLNATQAAIRAGYSEDTAKQIGYENLTKPYIADQIAQLQLERSSRTEITADYVLSSLHKVAERCMQEVPVTEYDHDEKAMVETGEFKFEHSGANKSLELLGKNLGLFVDKKEVSGPNGGPIQTQSAVIVAEMDASKAAEIYNDLMQ